MLKDAARWLFDRQLSAPLVSRTCVQFW